MRAAAELHDDEDDDDSEQPAIWCSETSEIEKIQKPECHYV